MLVVATSSWGKIHLQSHRSRATQVQYRFEKTGRYLVICINRNHFINDGMFGFVDVVGGDLD